MKKIIVIGCPGSGKSTLVFKMKDILGWPILHLDKVYHIDTYNHITRDELRAIVSEFAKQDKWIIDGNYISTVEERIQLADTIVIMDIDTEICVKNAIARSKKERGEDMAENFDNSQLKEGFLDFIMKFKNDTLPRIMELVEKYKNEKTFIILHNYDEVDKFVESLKNI